MIVKTKQNITEFPMLKTRLRVNAWMVYTWMWTRTLSFTQKFVVVAPRSMKFAFAEPSGATNEMGAKGYFDHLCQGHIGDM